MSNEVVAKTSNTSLSVDWSADDPFTELAAAVSLEGRFLKFAKGRWTTGTGKDEIKLNDAELVADIANVALGWRKWEDRRIVAHAIGLLKDRFRVPQRNDLGDQDQSAWARDNADKPSDPWVFGWYLRLIDPETDDNFVWSASSHGAIKEIQGLGAKFAKQRAIDPTRCVPLVKLATDGYHHRTFGWVDTPKLVIVDWRDNGTSAGAGGDGDAGGGGAPALAAPDGSDAAELDDSIPF